MNSITITGRLTQDPEQRALRVLRLPEGLRVRAEQEGVTVEEMERRRADVIPLKRANDPEDIAAMVVFLASPGARNITGQSFNGDGGLIPD